MSDSPHAQTAAPPPYPVRVEGRLEPGLSRGLWLVKWLLLIPHFIVLSILGIGVFVVVIIAFFAVLFTGRWPEGLRKFVIGYARWSMRVNAYFFFLTDAYPRFSLD